MTLLVEKHGRQFKVTENLEEHGRQCLPCSYQIFGDFINWNSFNRNFSFLKQIIFRKSFYSVFKGKLKGKKLNEKDYDRN